MELSKFEKKDIKDIEEIMLLNASAATDNPKDWANFIDWNIKHPEDLYWKITFVENMIGYIGYADATKKLTTRHISKHGDLFLEIYIHPKYTGFGFGKEAFEKSLNLIKKTDSYNIYASTYVSNTKAQNFFQKKLEMEYVEYNKKFNTILYKLKID